MNCPLHRAFGSTAHIYQQTYRRTSTAANDASMIFNCMEDPIVRSLSKLIRIMPADTYDASDVQSLTEVELTPIQACVASRIQIAS